MKVFKRFSNGWRNFIEKFFGESSIHCFPYVARRDFHFIERAFWLLILIFSTYCGFLAFAGQWKRYNENPTVLSIEILSQGVFRKPSFTICTNYTNHMIANELVERLFDVKPSSPQHQFYIDFVESISSTNYKNLGELERFANVSEFNKVDLLMIAREMKKNVPLAGNYFTHVITEMGMCQSSTKYYKLQNPFFQDTFKNISPEVELGTCKSTEVCRTSVTPTNFDNTSINKVYINNYEEVISGDGLDYETLSGTKICERTIKIDQIISEPQVIELKPKSRKCLFTTEPQSKYFNAYSTNLCKIDCRITRALKYCGCVPFFYAIRNVKVCDINGLLCLAHQPWYNTSNCECFNLCETTIMTKVSAKEQDLKFDRMLTIDLIFPKTRIQRSVLFDFNDLIVGFGGSVALFLGFSFLTGVELVYFIIEYCLESAINLVKPHIISVDRISVPEKKRLLCRPERNIGAPTSRQPRLQF